MLFFLSCISMLLLCPNAFLDLGCIIRHLKVLLYCSAADDLLLKSSTQKWSSATSLWHKRKANSPLHCLSSVIRFTFNLCWPKGELRSTSGHQDIKFWKSLIVMLPKVHILQMKWHNYTITDCICITCSLTELEMKVSTNSWN